MGAGRWRRGLWIAFLLAPALLVMSVFVLWPLLSAFRLAFYEFDGDAPAKMIPKEVACYSCHRDHAAVDTTFVQFYPTLLPLAKSKGTLSAAFLKDESAPPK